MRVNIKCFAGLSKRHDCDYRTAIELDVPEGGNVRDAAKSLGIGDDEVKFVFVNGKRFGMGAPMADGDNVTLVPATGGM